MLSLTRLISTTFHHKRKFRGDGDPDPLPLFGVGGRTPTLRVYQVKNFDFKTSNAEMQSRLQTVM